MLRVFECYFRRANNDLIFDDDKTKLSRARKIWVGLEVIEEVVESGIQ